MQQLLLPLPDMLKDFQINILVNPDKKSIN